MRNYCLMRTILLAVKKSDEPLRFLDFKGWSHDDIKEEFMRLSDEGLIAAEITLNNYVAVELNELTKEGNDFARNIENGKVWLIVYETLKDANLDLSYPLLKEVSDEIVKRYVMSKIPKDL